jgi:hypothetical protein
LRKVNHRIGEISPLNLGIRKPALHHHRVGQNSTTKIGSVKPARKPNHI